MSPFFGHENGKKQGSLVEISGNHLLKSGLKLSHLRMIVALEETLQISAAADLLNMSQPAASRALGEMESILNTPLYERAQRGVILTHYGEALAKRARTILLELREVDREIRELKTGNGGSVFLGSVQASAFNIVVPAISKISSAYPGLVINLEVETSNVLARELLSGKHDFIIGRIPDDMSPRLFEARELGIEKACLIVRSGHPLLEKGEVDWEDLVGHRWVFQPPGTLLRRTVEDMFLVAGIPVPEDQVNTSSALLTAAIVSGSDAIAPASYDMAQFITGQSSGAGQIRILPTRFEIAVRPFSLISARGRALPPGARLLYDLIWTESQEIRRREQLRITRPG